MEYGSREPQLKIERAAGCRPLVYTYGFFNIENDKKVILKIK